MSVGPTINIYESVFAQTDKTDAILVVQGKKLHVNKALLSCHSDYFDTLFNGDFKEKSMQEIPINNVKFQDFATLLSLVHPNPIKPTEQNAEKLLELADRFLLSAAKYHLEYFIISTNFTANKKLELAGTYDLENLLVHVLKSFKTKEELVPTKRFSGFSANMKAKILDRQIELNKVVRDRNPWRSEFSESFTDRNTEIPKYYYRAERNNNEAKYSSQSRGDMGCRPS
ncbi:hypothetical protein CRE_19722 [Caenorhabditis remanei]|uniref:BTB domain-containing protein n=1 Tax=Caenorhabditis remanei TaxID=31234 RepID=E3MTH1_CAERE|nr:hypothetical protein CRE_19722 [Caenorhabditis remanei]